MAFDLTLAVAFGSAFDWVLTCGAGAFDFDRKCFVLVVVWVALIAHGVGTGIVVVVSVVLLSRPALPCQGKTEAMRSP